MSNIKPQNLLVQIQELHCDSKIGKSRHFIAANRKEKISKRLGIVVIVIGVLIGSTLIKLVDDDLQKVVLGVLGFLSASLAAFQTFFNFSKDVENHRKCGNLYLDIARDCDNLISKFNDEFIDSKECQTEFEDILSRYKATNKEEEICPNSIGDYKKAYKTNEELKKRLAKLKNDVLYKID